MYNQVFVNKELFNQESAKSKDIGRFTEKLGELTIHLIRNIINSSRYQIKDIQNEVYYEMEMYIIERFLIKYLKYFDNTKGSGFALSVSIIRSLAYDFLRKIRTVDITGKPKYVYKRDGLKIIRDRITIMYLDDDYKKSHYK